jgi:hypothetical protein
MCTSHASADRKPSALRYACRGTILGLFSFLELIRIRFISRTMHIRPADLLLRIEVFAAAMTFQAARTCKTI